jgi:hypothetical protein
LNTLLSDGGREPILEDRLGFSLFHHLSI